MSNELEMFRPGGGVQRRVQRELQNLTVETGLATRRIDARAEVEAARVSAVAAVGSRAMQEVAMVTKLERDLAETVPAAVGRLTAIGDMTQIAMGSMVMNAARRMSS